MPEDPGVEGSERVRLRARLQLMGVLVTASWREDEPSPRTLAVAEGMLSVLAAGGVVADWEVDEWRARFRDPAEYQPPTRSDAADAATRERARAHLEALLSRVGPDDEASVTRAMRAVTLCAMSGALDEADATRWRDRVCGAAGLPTEAEARRLRAVCWGTQLDRVVAGGVEPVDGLRVLWVELHRDGVRVCFDRLLTPAQRTARAEAIGSGRTRPGGEWEDVELSDDLGTEYRQGGGGHSGGDEHGDRWLVAFAPAVPSRASLLTLTLGDASVATPLGGEP
jgi:hypothetical protein